MMTFRDYVETKELTEAAPAQSFPPIIYLRRQSLRQHADGTVVGLYKDPSSGLLIAIPHEWFRK